MIEINKPTNKNYWVATATDGSVVHIGETNPNQVTSTGLDSLDYTESVEEHLLTASQYAETFPDLPPQGEPVEAGVTYNDNGQAVRCVQSHTRTADAVEDIPALFAVARQQQDEWVQPTGAQDAYQTGDIVTYNGETWISKIDANTTVPDGDEPFNRYWEPYP